MIAHPGEIERSSFKIINKEIDLSMFCEEERAAVTRVIHTTADFEYRDILKFHPRAFSSGGDALQRGASIYADTNMIIAGVNKKKAGVFRIFTFIDDPEIAVQARLLGCTRSSLAVEKAIVSGNPEIFLIGNAPTALMALLDLVDAGRVKPALIVGVPVGFVGAEEAKRRLEHYDLPFITTRGRKGGSPVAVAILNSILTRM